MYGMNFVSEVLSEIKIKSIQMSQYLCYNKSTEQWNECGEQLGSFNEKSEFKMRSLCSDLSTTTKKVCNQKSNFKGETSEICV